MQPTLSGKIHGYFHSAREPLSKAKATIIKCKKRLSLF
ncbi:hypothetical protein A343_1681 [Porphyromonas gingivalis JCVI SC001]|nr:hypothetical protein A343_1681 [Porphyromonas gingivalis JCVI SC001]